MIGTEDPAAALRRGALTALRTGRVTLLHVQCRKTAHDVDEIIARVQSSRQGGHAHAVDLLEGGWSCTCYLGGGCAHELAVRMVTGHGPS